MRPRPGLFLLIPIVVLAGCANLFGPETMAGLSEKDAVRATDAVVIMALQSTKDMRSSYKVAWARVTQERPHTRLEPGFEVADTPEFGRITLVAKPAVEYHAFQVPAGKYVLDRAEFSQPVGQYQSAKKVLKPRPDTISFEVAAGEVAYIGTFSFEVPDYGFSILRARSNRMKEVRNAEFIPTAGPPDAVRGIRAQFPNVRGPIKRSVLVPITLTLPGGDNQ